MIQVSSEEKNSDSSCFIITYVFQLHLASRGIPDVRNHIQRLDGMRLYEFRQQTLGCWIRIVKGTQPPSVVKTQPPSTTAVKCNKIRLWIETKNDVCYGLLTKKLTGYEHRLRHHEGRIRGRRN